MTAISPDDLEQEQLAFVLERLPLGVIMFDTKRKSVTYANNAARRALHPQKLRRGGDLPEPWLHFSLSGYAERIVQPGVTLDERVELEDGHVYAVSGITAHHTSVATILIDDVSGRERRATAEREFLANAAHELLTPLTGIVGAAHVLQAGAKNVPQDRDHFIAHIAAECDRLTRIARSLLILARAQSGEEPPRLEIITLCDLLDELVEQINAPVTTRCDNELTVFADADLFVQALANLIGNAAHHGSGSEIVVEARAISQELAEIDIVDAQAPESDAAKFRRRFRSGAGRDGGGFGLGLSIAEQSLEAIGGRLLLNGGSARVHIPRGGAR
jgi:two-component system, OmpR family, sensor histidine kinase QseC